MLILKKGMEAKGLRIQTEPYKEKPRGGLKHILILYPLSAQNVKR
jgi:hypothetical protein